MNAWSYVDTCLNAHRLVYLSDLSFGALLTFSAEFEIGIFRMKRRYVDIPKIRLEVSNKEKKKKKCFIFFFH